jgi:IclR helix-turn-helix domain
MMPISGKPEIGRGQRGTADKFMQSAYADRYAGASQSNLRRLRKPVCADVLDTSFSLRRPSDYSMDQGARFEVHIEKGRGVFGAHARPFEAWLQGRDGQTGWAMKDVEDAVLSRVTALLAAGMSVREIAEETGATKSSVHRMKQRIEREKKEREAEEEGGRGDGG